MPELEGEEFLRTLLRFAAGDEDFDPDVCGFAVATEIVGEGRIRLDRWWPFERGEIVVLPGDEFSREPFGEGRNPAKWDIHFEWFGKDLEAARRRSAEVRGDDGR